jgi:hypothetical protein
MYMGIGSHMWSRSAHGNQDMLSPQSKAAFQDALPIQDAIK